MQKLLICLLLLTNPGFTTIHSQIPFLDSTYTWTEVSFGFGEAITMKYKFASEPIFFNGNFYYEILSNDQENGGVWKKNYIYLRYENNRIYKGNNTEDFAIIDFNLLVGEILDNPFGTTYTVLAIDSITLQNGERRKRQELVCDAGGPVHLFWIEGVGSTTGLALNEITCVTDIYGALLCVHMNDTLVYQNPEYNSCWITIVSSKETRTDNLHIFPNPASTEISIDATDHHFQNVSIIDLLGNIIFTENKPEVDISFLPPGYYFLQIELENSQIIMKPFVKE